MALLRYIVSTAFDKRILMKKHNIQVNKVVMARTRITNFSQFKSRIRFSVQSRDFSLSMWNIYFA